VLLYWSALTLGPVLLAMVKYYSGRVETAASGLPGIGWLAQALGWLAPIVVGVIIVAAGYKLIPNTHVRMASALGGALVSVPLWLLAKWGFRMYVDHFVLKGNLYGVLGVLPLFMLWLNVSWTVFLFGAQLAYTATNLNELKQAELADRIRLGPSDLVTVAAAVGAIFAAGQGPASRREIVRLAGLPADAVQQLLDQLVAAGVLCVIGDELSAAYLPARAPSAITVAELMELGDPRSAGRVAPGTPLAAGVIAAQRRSRAALVNLTLADVIAATPETEASEQDELGAARAAISGLQAGT
jgi:membrane protein